MQANGGGTCKRMEEVHASEWRRDLQANGGGTCKRMEEVHASETILAQDEHFPINRARTVDLMSKHSIPYPVPSEYVIQCRNIDA